MRAETELFKDKIEVSLDGRQVFYLFFGGAVIASLVFVLGVMVGKRVEARAHMDTRPATSAARDPLAALDQLSQRDELAFPSALAGAGDVPLGEIDQALAASVARRDQAAALTAAASKAADKKAATGKAEAGKDEDEGEGDRAEARSDSRFTLQLSSFRDRAEADAFFAKLTQAGYAPYIAEAEVPDKGTWYRVRLGRYDGYDAAIAAKREFEASQQIIAYVTRIKK